MNIQISIIRVLDRNSNCVRVKCSGIFDDKMAASIRTTITGYLQTSYPVIYLDTKDTTQVDLSAINEIIHTHYLLSYTQKDLVLVYKRNSEIANWVNTTSLHTFVKTAVIP